jgi:methionyl-tRNA formyltransferase
MVRMGGSSAPRMLFVGGTRRGHRVLSALLERGEPVCALIALEQDRHELDRCDDEMRRLAVEHGVPCRVSRRIDPDLESWILGELRPDLILVIGWRTMIPMTVVRAPALGCVGVHDSLLPHGRGFAPTNWAIINGADQSGVTLFHLSGGVDDGDVGGQHAIPIGSRTTAAELAEQVSDATLELILEHLPALKTGSAPRSAQEHERATYFCARRPEDGVIDWSASTETIDRLVRGLGHPYPGAWTTLAGAAMIVWEAEPVNPAPAYVGRVAGRPVGFREDGSVDVLTGDGVLRLRWVQVPGSDPLRPAQVIRSIRATLGRDDDHHAPRLVGQDAGRGATDERARHGGHRMKELIIPTNDVNSDTAIVTAWHVPDRSHVSAGAIVAEVETSKSVLEVAAPESGYLLRCAQEGEQIVLVSPLAYLFATSEALDEHAAGLAEARAAASSNGVRATAPATRRAAELGVDLASLPGRELVTVKRVEAAAGERPAAPPPQLPMPLSAPGGVERIALIGAGLGATQVIDILAADTSRSAVAIVDDDQEQWDRRVAGVPVVGGTQQLREHYAEGRFESAVICISTSVPARTRCREL